MPKNLAISRHKSKTETTCEPVPGEQALHYRALIAFQNVYIESSYTNACINMRSSRRSVIKLIRDLEDVLGSRLFADEKDGLVTPSPFGERFFYDMRFLESAMGRFMEKVEGIKHHRRALRVGASQHVFRTLLFRSHLRRLHTFQGFRVLFVQISSGDAAKSLASGEIDWFFDLSPLQGQRFISEKTGVIPFATYQRIGSVNEKPGIVRKVMPDSEKPSSATPILQESQWLRWLDRPAECKAGTCVSAPRISADPLYWEELEDLHDPDGGVLLHAIRLRQHPYEFLPGLAGKLLSEVESA